MAPAGPMGHTRDVSVHAFRPVAPDLPGVVGVAGRYPVRIPPALPLTIAGHRLLSPGPLRLYTCGITPYDVTHVGHASTFVWADLIASLAHATGVDAQVARNVTDVDDVLTAAASTRGTPYDEFALTQEFLFDQEMRALGVARPTMSPHARSHIRSVLRLAAALLDAGAAYEREGFVYFRGAHVPGTVGLGEEEALAASREYGDQTDVPGRESPFDVAVWRPSPEEHPAWPSPWGWGRPGWHAECAAMAMTCLSSSVDILLGGHDLAFPHHAYQVAMAEAATGVTPFARALVHVGEVRLEGRKMAKSTRNLVLVRDLLERYPAPVVRLALLDRPWDRPWDCTDAEFQRATGELERLYTAAGSLAGDDVAREEVLRVLVDELDVPGAVELAVAEGGAAARFLIDVLKLREAPLSP